MMGRWGKIAGTEILRRLTRTARNTQKLRVRMERISRASPMTSCADPTSVEAGASLTLVQIAAYAVLPVELGDDLALATCCRMNSR